MTRARGRGSGRAMGRPAHGARLAGRRRARRPARRAAVGGAVQRQRHLPAQSRPSRRWSQRSSTLSDRRPSLPYLVVVERDQRADRQRPAGRPGLRRLDPRAGLRRGPVHDRRRLPRSLRRRPCVPSQDGQAVLIPVPFDRGQGRGHDRRETSALVEGAETLRARIASVLGPAGIGLTSPDPAGSSPTSSPRSAGSTASCSSSPCASCFIILLIVYRSPILPFAVLVSAVFGLSARPVVIYPLAKNDVDHAERAEQGILFILVVGASTDYALLLVSRYKEELHDKPSAWVAIKRAWRAAGRADRRPVRRPSSSGCSACCSSSCGSTAGLGPVGALGIAGALLASLTFLPAVLLLFGRQVVLAVRPAGRPRARRGRRRPRGCGAASPSLVGRHPLGGPGSITSSSCWPPAAFAPTFKASGVTHRRDLFLDDTDSIIAQEVIGEHFPAGSAHADPDHRAPGRRRGRPAGGDQGPGARQRLHRPRAAAARSAGRAAQGRRRPACSSRPRQGGRPTARRPRRPCERLRVPTSTPSAPRSLVGGNAATNLDVPEASERDLRVIVPAILRRHLRGARCSCCARSSAPLLLVAANVVSFAATIGISALVFQHVFGFPEQRPVDRRSTGSSSSWPSASTTRSS